MKKIKIKRFLPFFLLLCVEVALFGELSEAAKGRNRRVSRHPETSPPLKGQRFLLPKAPQEPPSPKQISLPFERGITFGSPYIIPCSKWPDRIADVLMKEIAEHFGPTYCVQVPRYGSILQAMNKGILQIFSYPIWKKNYFTFLYPIFQNDLCIIVRKIDPEQMNISKCFCTSTWAATLGCLLLFGVTMRFIRRRSVPLDIVRTFLTGSFQESRNQVENYLSMLLCAFGVIMISAFCGKFMSFLTSTKEPYQPQTLEELNARVDKLLGNSLTHTIAKNFEDDEAIKTLWAKMPAAYEHEVAECLTSPKTAMVYPRESYERRRRSPLWVDKATGRSFMHLVPQCVLSPAFPVYITSPLWPHTERFSALLQKGLEAGLQFKIKSDYEFKRRRQKKWVKDVILSNEPTSLSLMAMVQPSVVLGVGFLLSIVAFTAELATFKWRQKNLKGAKLRKKKPNYETRAQVTERSLDLKGIKFPPATTQHHNEQNTSG